MNAAVKTMMERLAARAYGDRMKEIAGPHVVEINGQRWAFATDGKVCVYATTDHEVIVLTDTVREKVLWHYNATATGQTWQVFVSLLQGYCGPVVWAVECPKGKGLSKTVSEVYCSHCDEAGTVFPNRRIGYLAGLPLDLTLLACVLAPLAGTCEVGTTLAKTPSGKYENPCLVIRGSGWRVVMVGLTVDKDNAEEARNAPRLLDPTPSETTTS